MMVPALESRSDAESGWEDATSREDREVDVECDVQNLEAKRSRLEKK